jgi:hypothetical protein
VCAVCRVEQEARRRRVGLVDGGPPGRAQCHNRDREDPVVLTVDVGCEVVEQGRHRRREVARLWIKSGDGLLELVVFALQGVDLVEELARVPQCPEDPVLLAPHVSLQAWDEFGQEGHRLGAVAGL